MKRALVIFLFTAVYCFLGAHMACDKHPVTIPSPLPTPTPTATPQSVNINVTEFSFSPAAVTFQTGNNVIFTNTGFATHTITADDGFGSCTTARFIAPGTSVTLTYPAPITINYHCDFHSPACSFAGICDGTCDGMAGVLVAQ